MQALLSILNYYRKFIKKISQIAAPLIALIKKELRFTFGIEYKEVLWQREEAISFSYSNKEIKYEGSENERQGCYNQILAVRAKLQII